MILLQVSPPGRKDSNVDDDPVKAFVELEHYNGVTLIQKVHKSLVLLSKVIRGSILVDEAVTKLADKLMSQETPSSWQALWEGPEEPMEYIKVIVSKATRLQERWIGKNLDQDLNLSDLFHPETFLGALRQSTARQHQTSMESLRLANWWGARGASSKSSVRVTGIWVEGALMDGMGNLSEALSNSPSINPAPPCTLAWVPIDKKDSRGAANMSIPLYLNAHREKVLAFLEIAVSSVNENKWLQAGVVSFLDG